MSENINPESVRGLSYTINLLRVLGEDACADDVEAQERAYLALSAEHEITRANFKAVDGLKDQLIESMNLERAKSLALSERVGELEAALKMAALYVSIEGSDEEFAQVSAALSHKGMDHG